ncbi:MAG: SEC-C domain-containing protein [Isosphaeraceae bacterium]|nr:SEC-C domain-containing protein [Isosphaeraceae bacterium]
MSETARELVDRMAEAGERPDPALLEAILAHGEAAVEPLLEVLRRDLRGWPAEAPLVYTMGLLSDLRSPAAIPDFVNVLRRNYNELLEGMERELGRFGPAVVPALLEVVRERSADWYGRSLAIDGARHAAGDDVVLRSQIADTLREELPLYIDQGVVDLDDDMPIWPVDGLASLADPLSRDLIARTFALGLSDHWVINEEDVERLYAQGGAPDIVEASCWIDEYKESYNRRSDVSDEQPDDEPPPSEEFRRLWEESKRAVVAEMTGEDVEPLSHIEPIRKAAHRPGRNDPCWCGSDKKYKKCHLGSDET